MFCFRVQRFLMVVVVEDDDLGAVLSTIGATCAKTFAQLEEMEDLGDCRSDQRQSSLAHAQRAVAAAIDAAQEAAKGVLRHQLKSQAAAFELKLQTARVAAEVNLNNKVVEMEAAATKQREECLKDLGGSRDAMLRELQQQLLEATQAAGIASDVLRTAQKQQKAADAARASAEADAARLQVEVDAASASLDTALEELVGTRDENRTLGECVDSIRAALEQARSHAEQLAVGEP